MPGLNRNGPMGNGPLTGGGRGMCNPSNKTLKTRFIGGFGRSSRGGYGRGSCGSLPRGFSVWNSKFDPKSYMDDPANEIEMLITQEDFLKKRLKNINKQIRDLEKKAKKPSDSGEKDA